MLTPIRTLSYPNGQSPWWPRWLPACEVAGAEEMPVISHAADAAGLAGMKPLTARNTIQPSNRQLALHGYLHDWRMAPLLNNPARYEHKVAQHWGLVLPDFSMYEHMTRTHRVMSTWYSRALGVYFQSRGLRVIPGIRWAVVQDLEFALDGIPDHAPVAVSTQSLTRNNTDLRTFREGLIEISRLLKPATLVVYGPCPQQMWQELESFEMVLNFPTDASRRYSSEATH